MTDVILGRHQRLLVLLAVAALSWVATSTATNAGSPGPAQIVIKDFMFMPMSLTIKAGSAVTWANKDDEPHTVVSDTGLFRSGAVDTDETFTVKFDKPGTYHFTCSIHPRMIGTIVVE
jgi:plastocyanin